MDTKATVLNALKKSEKPLRTGDIAEMTGLDKKEISKAIKQLKEKDEIMSPKRCYYAIKE